MNYIVFDSETRNIFQDVGTNNPADLDLSIVSIYESANGTYTSYTVEELPKLWPIIEHSDALVGYNSDHFDIPLLNKYYAGDLTRIKSIDIIKDIKASLGRRPKLDDVAEATLGEKKTAHGLEAVTWWKQGKIDLIKKYCEADVALTRKLFEFIRDKKYIKIKDFTGKIVQVPINTDMWSQGSNSVMTQSLPF